MTNKKEEVMVCCVCGEIDVDYTAYCVKCGRVPHRIMSLEKQEQFKKVLESFK